MPAIEGTTSAEYDKAADAAVAERAGRGDPKPFLTGPALAGEDAELARNRQLLNPAAADADSQRRLLRAPAAPPSTAIEVAPESIAPSERPLRPADMPDLYTPEHERPAARGPAAAAAETQVETVAAAAEVAPQDDEGARLEQELLVGSRQSGALADDLPDEEVVVGGRKIPLSRIREGLLAAKERNDWQRTLQQRQEALGLAVEQTLADAQRQMVEDPVGALRKLGLTEEQLKNKLAAAGLASPATGSAAAVAGLPDDADPLTKALFADREQLKGTVASLVDEIKGVKQSIASERAQAARSAGEQQRMAALSGVKSELVASASKMPSMSSPGGKLSPTGSLLVDAVETRLRSEIPVGTSIDHASLKARAFDLFGEMARRHGITPKAEQARKALEGKKPVVLSKPGATIATAPGASPRAKNPLADVDWTDDVARRKALHESFSVFFENAASG